MAEQFEGKKIPWLQYEDYVKLHQGKTSTLQNMLDNDIADKPAIERMLPRTLH